MAIRQLLVYLNEGYDWIVDIDLEKFFDNVPQDKLDEPWCTTSSMMATQNPDTKIPESRSYDTGI
ncbi:MAG: hypothetical protein V8Q42_13735 [Anaerovoracaceae bacterium]